MIAGIWKQLLRAHSYSEFLSKSLKNTCERFIFGNAAGYRSVILLKTELFL